MYYFCMFRVSDFELKLGILQQLYLFRYSTFHHAADNNLSVVRSFILTTDGRAIKIIAGFTGQYNVNDFHKFLLQNLTFPVY